MKEKIELIKLDQCCWRILVDGERIGLWCERSTKVVVYGQVLGTAKLLSVARVFVADLLRDRAKLKKLEAKMEEARFIHLQEKLLKGAV